MNCANCGKEIPDFSKFCAFCGAAAEVKAVEEPEVVVEPEVSAVEPEVAAIEPEIAPEPEVAEAMQDPYAQAAAAFQPQAAPAFQPEAAPAFQPEAAPAFQPEAAPVFQPQVAAVPGQAAPVAVPVAAPYGQGGSAYPAYQQAGQPVYGQVPGQAPGQVPGQVPMQAPQPQKKKMSTGAIVGIVVGIVLALLLVVGVGGYFVFKNLIDTSVKTVNGFIEETQNITGTETNNNNNNNTTTTEGTENIKPENPSNKVLVDSDVCTITLGSQEYLDIIDWVQIPITVENKTNQAIWISMAGDITGTGLDENDGYLVVVYSEDESDISFPANSTTKGMLCFMAPPSNHKLKDFAGSLDVYSADSFKSLGHYQFEITSVK